jgi:hypothetical protein
MEESLNELSGRLEHLAGHVGTRFIASGIRLTNDQLQRRGLKKERKYLQTKNKMKHKIRRKKWQDKSNQQRSSGANYLN